jgi:copper chaperone
MEEKTVYIPSISCGHCVMTIKREVGKLEGVEAVEGDEKTKKVTVKWRNPTTWEKISATLKEAGYQAD